MNLRELDALIQALSVEDSPDFELIDFYKKRRVKLLHKIADELIKTLKL